MELTSYLLGKKAGGGTPISLQTKAITITENGSATINPDEEYDGLSSVEVTTNVPTILQEKDVNFYDYIGNLVYAYTAQEFGNLTELPAGPTHAGMTFQGWNWQLSEAQAYVSNYGALDIGETCVTSNGETRLYIELSNERKSPYLGFGINGSVTIDWGDGTSTQTVTGTSATTLKQTQHSYASGGSYVITLTGTSDVNIIGDLNNDSKILLSSSSNNKNMFSEYLGALKKIEAGTNLTLGYGALTGTTIESINLPTEMASNKISEAALAKTNLQSVVFPRNITTIQGSVIRENLRLKRAMIPNTATTLGEYAFYGSTIERVYLPESITTIGKQLFVTCPNIEKLRYPNNITSFAQQSCGSMPRLKEVTLPSSLTTLVNSSIATNPQLRKVTIPASVTTMPGGTINGLYGLVYLKFQGNYTDMAKTSTSIILNSPFLKTIDMRNNTEIPTVNTYTFNGVASDYQVIVPDNLYSSWIADSNWSSYASHVVSASNYTE